MLIMHLIFRIPKYSRTQQCCERMKRVRHEEEEEEGVITVEIFNACAYPAPPQKLTFQVNHSTTWPILISLISDELGMDENQFELKRKRSFIVSGDERKLIECGFESNKRNLVYMLKKTYSHG